MSRFRLYKLERNKREIRGEGRNTKTKGRDAVVFAFWRSRNADTLQKIVLVGKTSHSDISVTFKVTLYQKLAVASSLIENENLSF